MDSPLPINRSQHLLVEWPLFRYPWLLVTTGRWGQCSECSVPASTASQRTGCSWCIMEVWGNRFCETPCTNNNVTITILSCASRSILFSVKTQNSTQFVSHKRRWWLSRGPEKVFASTKMTNYIKILNQEEDSVATNNRFEANQIIE